jgi:hypothetical protein
MELVPHRHVSPCWSSMIDPCRASSVKPGNLVLFCARLCFLLFSLQSFLTSARRTRGCLSLRFELISFYCSRDRRTSSGIYSGTSDNLPHYPGVFGCIRQSNIGPHPLIIACSGLVVCAFVVHASSSPHCTDSVRRVKGLGHSTAQHRCDLIPVRQYQISLRLFVMVLVVTVSKR